MPKEELAAPDRFRILNPPRMGPRRRTRPHEANEIGTADLCRLGVVMMMMMMNTGLIQLRNEMAHYLHSSSDKSTLNNNDEDGDWPFGRLPRPINNERTCAGCPQLLACAIYQRSAIFLTSHLLSMPFDLTSYILCFFSWLFSKSLLGSERLS